MAKGLLAGHWDGGGTQVPPTGGVMAMQVFLQVLLALSLLASLALFILLLVVRKLRVSFNTQIIANLCLALIVFGVLVRVGDINQVTMSKDMTPGYCTLWWMMRVAEKVTLPGLYVTVGRSLFIQVQGKMMSRFSRAYMLVLPWLLGLLIGVTHLLMDGVTTVQSSHDGVYTCTAYGTRRPVILKTLDLIFMLIGPLVFFFIILGLLFVFYSRRASCCPDLRLQLGSVTVIYAVTSAVAIHSATVNFYSTLSQWLYFALTLLSVGLLAAVDLDIRENLCLRICKGLGGTYDVEQKSPPAKHADPAKPAIPAHTDPAETPKPAESTKPTETPKPAPESPVTANQSLRGDEKGNEKSAQEKNKPNHVDAKTDATQPPVFTGDDVRIDTEKIA